jgi:hypothetical protein
MSSPNNNKQPVVVALDHGLDLSSSIEDSLGTSQRKGQPGGQSTTLLFFMYDM